MMSLSRTLYLYVSNLLFSSTMLRWALFHQVMDWQPVGMCGYEYKSLVQSSWVLSKLSGMLRLPCNVIWCLLPIPVLNFLSTMLVGFECVVMCDRTFSVLHWVRDLWMPSWLGLSLCQSFVGLVWVLETLFWFWICITQVCFAAQDSTFIAYFYKKMSKLGFSSVLPFIPFFIVNLLHSLVQTPNLLKGTFTQCCWIQQCYAIWKYETRCVLYW